MEAVKKDGTALQFASRKLQKVPSIIAVSKHTEEINRLETLKLNGTASKADLHALYKEQLYENPEQYKNLPTWYFRDENAEELAEINSKIGQALKDRFGEKVSEEDELYATNILTMMNETIREKRQEIAKEEAQKLEEQKQNAEESKKVEGYKDSIDSQIANLGKGE